MSVPVPLPRIEAFEKLGYGMFVHWGIYSQMGKGEWAMHFYQIPIPEYEKLVDTFTACDFNAEDLARTARDAGMKYITLTTRHHDGFSLYDTCGLNTYDAPYSPAGRDLVAEFVAACRKYDIVPFFYHTTLDWHWHGKKTQDLSEEEFNEYLEYLRESVAILCRNYGKIGGLWFDGNWSRPDSDWKEGELYGTIRKYQPDAIIVNNTGLHELGRIGHPEIDSVTFEQGNASFIDREGHAKYVAGEVCRTMNNHWAIGRNDFNFFSPRDIIELLSRSRRCRANLLLNIGPEAQGAIPAYEKAALLSAGKWCKMFEEAIYEPVPATEVKCHGRDFMLRNGKDFYYFVFDLRVSGDANVATGIGGAGARAIDNFTSQVKSAVWMDNNEEIRFAQNIEHGILSVDCTGYPYGTNTVVRVMKIQTA